MGRRHLQHDTATYGVWLKIEHAIIALMGHGHPDRYASWGVPGRFPDGQPSHSLSRANCDRISPMARALPSYLALACFAITLSFTLSYVACGTTFFETSSFFAL